MLCTCSSLSFRWFIQYNFVCFIYPRKFFHYRKKKLTNHWRNFIRPLMWRCKWTELRIKEMELQALKYARELAAYDQRKQPYDQRKQLGFDQFIFEGLGSKSLPFSSQCFKKKTIKRRKRKRVEDTTDLTSYMSKHHLFSYLGTSFFFNYNSFGALLSNNTAHPPHPLLSLSLSQKKRSK